ncbi:MAG: hypothetical protein WAQ05_21050 [Rubrivivax sp.]
MRSACADRWCGGTTVQETRRDAGGDTGGYCGYCGHRPSTRQLDVQPTLRVERANDDESHSFTDAGRHADFLQRLAAFCARSLTP